MVPDMLKYLVEFSRDYFKKFMIFLSIQRNKQIGTQQQGTIPQQQQNSNQSQINGNLSNNQTGIKQSVRSKSSMSHMTNSDNQQNMNNQKIPISKVGIIVSNEISEADQQMYLSSPKVEEVDENSQTLTRKKSSSFEQKNEDVKLLGSLLKQVNQDQSMKRIEFLHLQKDNYQQKENDLQNKTADLDKLESFKDYSAGKQLSTENDPISLRRKSILLKQSQQTSSSPLRLIQNKKMIGTSNECNLVDEKISPRQTPIQLQHARSPLKQRINNQAMFIQSQSSVNYTYNPYVKKSDLSIFPSTLSISWYISKEKEIKIIRQSNLNSVIPDIDYSNMQSFTDKLKRSKGNLEDYKMVFIQMYEQSRQRNGFINSTIQIYNEKFKTKYPKKTKQYNEEREKEDRETYSNTINSNQTFSAYYFSSLYNEDMLGSQKKGDANNTTQMATQKMFIVKSAASKNRKNTISQAVTPPPYSASNSILNINSSQRVNNSNSIIVQMQNNGQQNLSNAPTPIQQTSSSISNGSNSSSNNSNNLNFNKPKTVQCLSQVPSFSNSQIQQQRTFSPSKYHKVDHTNIQNKLKIVRLTNSRCNSALMRPKISQTEIAVTETANNYNNNATISNLNNLEEKQLGKTPISCQEIKLSSKVQDQISFDQSSQMMRQKSNSFIHSKKQSSNYNQSILGGIGLDTQQSRNQIQIEGEDFIIKTNSVQELDDDDNVGDGDDNELDDQKFKEENSVMEASFSLPIQNSKQFSTRKIGDVINIQDEKDTDEQNSLTGFTNTPINNMLYKEELNGSNHHISKFEVESNSKPLNDFLEDHTPGTPTNDTSNYFVMAKKKRKNIKKVSDQGEKSENKRALSQQGHAAPTNLRELISSPHIRKEMLSKSQRINYTNLHQSSMNQTNSTLPFQREHDKEAQPKSSQIYQYKQPFIQPKIEEEKSIQKKGSADGSQSSSSASSSLSQNIGQSQLSQQNSKFLNFKFQGNSNFNINSNNNNSENIFSNQPLSQNKLPLINQSVSKGGIHYGSKEIKLMESNDEDGMKSKNRNFSNHSNVKKVSEYSSNYGNNQYTVSQQQNIFQTNSKMSTSTNQQQQQQQLTEESLKNYPHNLNVMTDKFKNLLLQKINKIKGEKQQQHLIDQGGNSLNGAVLGGQNGIPLKVISQQQGIVTNQPYSSNQHQIVISQSRILQKQSINTNNLINGNSITSSTQPSRQNHFNTSSTFLNNQENAKSRPPSNNLIESENKIINQISNTLPIRKSKNISFSVDNQGSSQLQNYPIKIVNQKNEKVIASGAGNINNGAAAQTAPPDIIQQLLTQPKNSIKDIYTSTQQQRQKSSQTNTSKKVNPQKNYSISSAQTAQVSVAQQIAMNLPSYQMNNNINGTSNQSTQLKTGQNALQNIIGTSNVNVQKTNGGGFNMKLLKIQGNTINNDKKQETTQLQEGKPSKSIHVQDITKQFTTSLVTQLQPFFQSHQIQTQK